MDALSGGPIRCIVRFGQQMRGDDLPSIPLRFRGGPGGPAGRLDGIALRPLARQAWLRLSQRGPLPWSRRESAPIPLGSAQEPVPPADAVDLESGLRVRCHDGYVGRLEGMAVDARSGAVLDLLLRVRGDVLAAVRSNSDPLAALQAVSGQQILVSPTSVTAVTKEKGAGPFGAEETVLQLDASPEQLASATVLRPDGDVTSDIWRILEANPAIAPFMARLTVVVRDGDVTLLGRVPTPRHRASAEQDVWHVPGVFAVHNDLAVGG
jgi:osmotically-inducible protein OsmY